MKDKDRKIVNLENESVDMSQDNSKGGKTKSTYNYKVHVCRLLCEPHNTYVHSVWSTGCISISLGPQSWQMDLCTSYRSDT